MAIVLVGGGPDTTRSLSCLAPFVAACRRRGAARVGLLLAGDRASAEHFAPEYRALLPGLSVEVVPLADGVGDVTRLDAVVVGGGPTPVYHDALRDVLPVLRGMVAAGVPYLGFSAGAMVAAELALVGGYRAGGAEVCPVGWSEGLDELTLRPGIGLVPWTVEVHAAQAGTLGRAVAAVAGGGALSVVALDEDTALHIDDDGARHVLGSGRAWWVTSDDAGGARVDATSPAVART